MLKGWALVEGTLADKYGLSLRDIVEMSWRRFVVLYQYLFTTGALTRVSADEGDSQTPATPPTVKGGRAYDDVDWNALTGSTPADQSSKRSFSDFVDNAGLTRKVVD